MKYRDEITDFGDLGQCIYNLMRFGGFGVKDKLWDLLDHALTRGSFEEMKELFEWWTKERDTATPITERSILDDDWDELHT